MELHIHVAVATILTEIQNSIFHRFNSFVLNNISLSSKDLIFHLGRQIHNYSRATKYRGAPWTGQEYYQEKTGVTGKYRTLRRLVYLKATNTAKLIVLESVLLKKKKKGKWNKLFPACPPFSMLFP